MSTTSISSLDDIRTAHPELGVGLYAIDPLGPVTLELITPDGDTFSFKAMTAEAAIAQAFPSDNPPDTDPPADPEPVASIFD